MSFQGDVGGIGLADLLQSLARGRSGVLSLHSKDGLRATLGVEDGALHLLPEPDEDPETWRKLARIAWVDAPETNVDALRMEEIARARRLETLYRLLDSSTVHFRFAPGPVPHRPEGSGLGSAEQGLEKSGPGRESVWCAPQPIEGALLEYARLKDDWDTLGCGWIDVENVVFQRLDSGAMKGDVERLHRVCDGTSSLIEMADRLGWPLRQARNVAIAELRRGALRYSTPPELLYLVQHELARAQTERAVGRLVSWLRAAPGGPLAEIDAHGFEAEWQSGRLQPVLHALPPRFARAFLRRLDHGTHAPMPSLARWREYAREKGGDRTTQVRLVAWQLRASVDPNVPGVRDLLALARAFLRENRALAAAALLRIAAARAPETLHVRVEIGTAMAQAGIADEAAPFVLEVARPEVEAGRGEDVLPALRALTDALPGDRDIRRLYLKARARSVQRTLVRKHSLVALALVAALGVGALVQFVSHRETQDRVSRVLALADDPAAALLELDAAFPGDESPRVAALRAELTERKRVTETAIRTAWSDEYNGAAIECTVGDVELGLHRALKLPPPPTLRAGDEPLPLVSDLYNGLAARLDAQVGALGARIEDTQAQMRAEERLLALLRSLDGLLAEQRQPAAREFGERLTVLRQRVEARGEQRARERAEREKRENLAAQDLLINTARAHEKAGDHKRSLEAYRELVATDPSGSLGRLFQREIAVVEARVRALSEARTLAEAGRQPEAYERLKAALADPDAWLLPWRVSTVPPGARARMPDGTERVTPFTLETTWREQLEFTLELEGHAPHRVVSEHPANVAVILSRLPERAWGALGRVEAPPVAVGDDHIVVDRAGTIARLTRDGACAWSANLSSLGGIGRAPVFLPGRPGHLLVVTEDGEVWIVAAADGKRDGPWSAAAPPVAGPAVIQNQVVVRFKNGTSYTWTDRLKPEEAEGSLLEDREEHRLGSSAGLAVLRRRASSATRFASPWTAAAVEVGPEVYTVRHGPDGERVAHFRRAGDWTYLAWEAPSVTIPRGRLWISDEQGLRTFAP
ncbi:MAG: DUF4388 domain-containing protein [Planctomycetes bacterium]|nr:DUF4388 domain-containing protein [Planctomycetota bacterium]